MATKTTQETNGFTLLEVMITVAIIGILSVAAVSPLKGLLASIDLNTSVITVKRELMLARTRAISNTSVHTGVYFDTGARPQRVIAFFDSAGNYQYDSVTDQKYGPVKTFSKDTTIRIFGISNACVIFRGDGSLKSGFGGTIVMKAPKANNKQKTILVSSSGRIKVTSP